MNRVLLLAQETAEARAVVQYLLKEQLYPVLVGRLETALDRCQEVKPDAFLVDWATGSRGSADGDRQLLTLKAACDAPTLALVSIDHEVSCEIPQGADDFIIAPYNYSEMGFRLKRLIWKSKPFSIQKVIRVGDLVVDQNRWQAYLAGLPLELTYKEYQLLAFLASHPGNVFSREDLLREVWGQEYFGGTRTVDVHVRKLRAKVEDATHSFIDTVRNVGYKFKG